MLLCVLPFEEHLKDIFTGTSIISVYLYLQLVVSVRMFVLDGNGSCMHVFPDVLGLVTSERKNSSG